jgi:hypothetical protein
MAPLCISALKAAVVGQDGLDLCLKALSVWGLSCLAIVPVQLCAPRYGPHLLNGIAAAMLVHTAVGLWQLYGFTRGEFPLAGLYVNPSFLSVQDNAETIVRYVQRPFGLFPEPSAMSASLAPWVLILFSLSFGLIRLRSALGGMQRFIFGAAALAGLGLVIVSRSGHAAAVCVGVVALVAAWFVRARATSRTFLVVAAVFGVFLPLVVYLAAVSVGDRLGGKTAFGNSSWGERADSLVYGFDLVASGDLATHLLGTGVGQMSPAIQAATGLNAVFSVFLTYLFETGVVGGIALAWVGCFLLRQWSASRFDMTFALVGLVWLVGVTVITSYEQLLPLWMTLGWLTVWSQVCVRNEGPSEGEGLWGYARRVGRPQVAAGARI